MTKLITFFVFLLTVSFVWGQGNITRKKTQTTTQKTTTASKHSGSTSKSHKKTAVKKCRQCGRAINKCYYRGNHPYDAEYVWADSCAEADTAAAYYDYEEMDSVAW